MTCVLTVRCDLRDVIFKTVNLSFGDLYYDLL